MKGKNEANKNKTIDKCARSINEEHKFTTKEMMSIFPL
jgi:hypothetical protein